MAAPTGPEDARNLGQPGCYVYGIVPADVELTGDVRGVGDPPGRIQLVRHGNLVALVSEVNLTGGLGTPDDLRAHAQVLDTAVVEVPVLPLRFGTVKVGMVGRHRLVFVPLDRATVGPGSLKVAYTKKQVKDAPSIDTDGELIADDEEAVFKHYGLTYQPGAGGERRLGRR